MRFFPQKAEHSATEKRLRTNAGAFLPVNQCLRAGAALQPSHGLFRNSLVQIAAAMNA